MMKNFIIKKLDLPIPLEKKNSTLFTQAIRALEIGEAISVENMATVNASSRAVSFGLKQSPKRKFTIAKLDNGSIGIWRIE